ncbi:replication-associated recombination protein A [Metamycoplasma equirhinis]|uniref:replication-associated recombination protein A n=1 Tax=Metamycoplasma equirhinis TaxID=92402 RepID=UPI0035946158
MKSNLANLVRPSKIDEFVCDDNLMFLFKNIIKNVDFRSFIFYGPPGCGKTTISSILAKEMKVSFDYFNAAIGNKEDLLRKLQLNKIIVIDEIHRLNKDKQDVLLPYVENDLITIYATTTENPYFKINPALRSRCAIIEIKKPNPDDLSNYLKKISLKNNFSNKIGFEIYKFIALQSNGDFRSAINCLELVNTLSQNKEMSLDEIKKIIPSIQFTSDKDGDKHYDFLSAFHKSLRGSDVNAALYWGALIIKSGDFDGLFRRMICATYEDVGIANPNLGSQVISAINAFERLGLPEGYLPLSNAIINIALSPKSNSAYLAIEKVNEYINGGNIFDVPLHLKDAHYSSASKLGRGVGYKYPHNYKNHYINQQYLPNELINEKFYIPQQNGYEEKINQILQKMKGEK